jgi:hypothetical protein
MHTLPEDSVALPVLSETAICQRRVVRTDQPVLHKPTSMVNIISVNDVLFLRQIVVLQLRCGTNSPQSDKEFRYGRPPPRRTKQLVSGQQACLIQQHVLNCASCVLDKCDS